MALTWMKTLWLAVGLTVCVGGLLEGASGNVSLIKEKNDDK